MSFRNQVARKTLNAADHGCDFVRMCGDGLATVLHPFYCFEDNGDFKPVDAIHLKLEAHQIYQNVVIV